MLKVEDVSAAFEGMVKETADSAKRDERKWATQYQSYYSLTSARNYAAEVPYTRTWITDRWAYLKTQFP